jgi:hypothetical protein
MANVVDIFSTLLLSLLSAAQLVFRAIDFVPRRDFLEVEFRSEGLVGSAENGQSFINEHPDQPAAKRALVFEAWRIPRCFHPAVFNSTVGLFRAAENSTRDEVKQPVAAPKSGAKYGRIFVQPFCKKEIVRHKSPNIGFVGSRLLTCTCLTIFKNKK